MAFHCAAEAVCDRWALPILALPALFRPLPSIVRRPDRQFCAILLRRLPCALIAMPCPYAPRPTLADVQPIFKSQEFIQPDEENSLVYVKTRGTGMDQTGNQKIFTA